MKYAFKMMAVIWVFLISNSVYGIEKNWCLPQNEFQRNIPFHKFENGIDCPENTTKITKKSYIFQYVKLRAFQCILYKKLSKYRI